MNTQVINLLKTFIIVLFIPNSIFAIENKVIEDTLIGIQIGSTVVKLDKKYPNLYSHKLMMGEVLYEACNQDKLEVITFTENPWSKSFITHIWTRQEKDQTVCRDEAGRLPDLNITIETPKGIGLGDSKEKIIRQYGEPDNVKKISIDWVVLTYVGKGELVENMKLIFVLNSKNLVTSISLMGNIPGTHIPFSK